MAKDYYDILGVERGASDDDLSKAYRTLARKHHPDLHPNDASAKEKFQEVQHAFDVLSDPKKRKQYDRFGPNFEAMGGANAGGAGPQGWPPGGFPGGQGDVEIDLGEIFGGASGAGGFADLFRNMGRGSAGPARTRSAPRRGADLEHEITVPFATAVKGGEAAISVSRHDGKNETINIKVPAGIEDGKKIRLRGQGEPAPGGAAAGDLLLTVRVAPHPQFERNGSRLDVVAPISLAEAVQGAKIDVPTPHGTVTVSVPQGTSSGKKLRLKGQGVRPEGKPEGDLYVELQIQLPAGLTEEEQQQIAEITANHPQDPRADLRW